MKGIIIYHSKTGFTKKYAQWIGEELHFECLPYEKRNRVSLAEYDILIYGGSVHAGSIMGLKWLKGQKNGNQSSWIVFATGAIPAGPDTVRDMLEQNLKDTQMKGFYFPGGINYEAMGAGNRLLMSMFRKMISGKKDKTPQEEEMAAALQSSYDLSDRKAIRPLIEYVHSKETGKQSS